MTQELTSATDQQVDGGVRNDWHFKPLGAWTSCHTMNVHTQAREGAGFGKKTVSSIIRRQQDILLTNMY